MWATAGRPHGDQACKPHAPPLQRPDEHVAKLENGDDPSTTMFEQVTDKDFTGPPATGAVGGVPWRGRRAAAAERRGRSARRPQRPATVQEQDLSEPRVGPFDSSAGVWSPAGGSQGPSYVLPTFTSSSHRGSSMTRKIDWRHIDEKTFNDLVETLLVQEEIAGGSKSDGAGQHDRHQGVLL